MKPFEQQNHYEVLDLSPDATPFEIRQAYKAAVKLYARSMATYSLFSEDEAKKILCRIEEAFLTLTNEQIRSQYDQILVTLGQVRENPPQAGASKEPIALFDFKSSREPKSGTSLRSKPEQSRPAITAAVNDILAHDVLTGYDLKKIRTELGVSLGEITHQTKVRPDFLRFIEQDQFDKLPSRLHLRSFLKAYVQCLHLQDPQAVVSKYMRRIVH
jgi:curved DNA-binding protein CbpA